MINFKSILAVIVVAILIGILFVMFEKSLHPAKTVSSNSSSSQELAKDVTITQTSSLLNLPTPAPNQTPINQSTILLNEASSLEMRDYSGLFEQIKDTLRNND